MRFSPAKILILGFLAVIILGTILLMLPISTLPDKNLNLLEAIFTATSAVCVTGLVIVDTGTTFSLFGKTVIISLIQIGGLGFMSFAVLFFLLMRKRIGLKERVILKEGLNLNSIQGIVGLVKSILLLTLCFEFFGTIFSFLIFRQTYHPLDALGISIFHTVSSFNNAGFDVLGNYQSLVAYKNNIGLNIITSLLIIGGGLGFIVHREIIWKRNFKRFSLHSKIVIISTLFLIITGSILFYLTENISIMGAIFQSITARTAGFNTFDISNFTDSGKILMCILMFIGASSGSTGGGIKTTTFFILVFSMFSFVSNTECVIYHKKIADETRMKAFVIAGLAIFLILFDIFLIPIFEPFTFIDIVFEVISAFGTVGLTTGITSQLTIVSKILLILTMFLGRLGPLTVAFALNQKKCLNIHYPEERILVG